MYLLTVDSRYVTDSPVYIYTLLDFDLITALLIYVVDLYVDYVVASLYGRFYSLHVVTDFGCYSMPRLIADGCIIRWIRCYPTITFPDSVGGVVYCATRTLFTFVYCTPLQRYRFHGRLIQPMPTFPTTFTLRYRLRYPNLNLILLPYVGR